MTDLGTFLKGLRKKNNLSQRGLAAASGISFRQIQRIEYAQSDITLKKLTGLLGKFGFEIKITSKEPDWDALISFGLPANMSGIKNKKYKYSEILKNIICASRFLSENKHDMNYARRYDAFKAMLLALKTHYPARFREIEQKHFADLSHTFQLKKIEGRHIKLRNICLGGMSGYFKESV
jgi:transcriptional regulator with XRE-family HTH domain